MPARIRVAILEDHQSIIDGYIYRLSMAPDIQIVATALFGEDLELMLANNTTDVLLMDVSVPNSAEDRNPYPILHVVPRLLQRYPGLSILIISVFTQQALIEALVNTGVSGYIFKDDQASIQQLAKIVGIVANGGVYFSKDADREIRGNKPESILTRRQLEALSLCASLPNRDTITLANQLGITGSTLRNLLSGAYLRLGVRTRTAAIARAHQLGILPVVPGIGESGNKNSPRRRRPTPKAGDGST
jgi:DNA-binding NarL/FixJ family response regulator